MRGKGPAVRGVIFDMDGTLFDTEPISKACWKRAAENLGVSLPDQVVMDFTGKNPATVRDIVLASQGPQFDFDRLWAAKEQEYAAAISGGVPFKPGLQEMLLYLEAQHIPKAVATSSSAERTRLTLQYAGLAGEFPVVVCGEDIEKGKPAPDIFLAAAKALGQDPAHCLVIEDSGPGLKAGCAAGCFVIYIPDIVPVPAEDKAGIIAQLTDLAQAARWIKTENREKQEESQEES